MSIPIHFAPKQDYISKLTELMLVQAEIERLSAEVIAAKDIRFKFDKYLVRSSSKKKKVDGVEQVKMKEARHEVHA